MNKKTTMRCTIIDFSTSEIITYILPEGTNKEDVEDFVFDNTDHRRSNCQWMYGDNLKIGFKNLIKKGEHNAKLVQ